MSKHLKWLLPLSLLTLIAVVGGLMLPASATHAAHTSGASGGAANWSQGGFNGRHTYYNPDETTISENNVAQLTVKWQAPIAGSPPVVVNNVLYTLSGQDGNEYALNATTGQQLWKVHIGWNTAPPYLTPPSNAVANNIVYVAGNKNLYALNAQTGATIWRFTRHQYQPNAPVAANNAVYFLSGYATLYALNAGTGAVLWKSTNALTVPADVSGVLYTSGYDSSGGIDAEALDARMGKQLWLTLPNSSIIPTPSVVNGLVYYSLSDQTNDGYCISDSINALNAQTGVLVWQQQPAANGNCIDTGTAVANNTVYLTVNTGNVTYLDSYNAQTGNPLWSSSPMPYTFDPPTVANGVIYVAGDNSGSGLVGVDANTGKLLWAGNAQTTGSPVVVNGMVYVIVGSNLTALGL